MFKSCCCVSNKKAVKNKQNNENKENGTKIAENVASAHESSDEKSDGQLTKLKKENCDKENKEICDNLLNKLKNGPESLTSTSTDSNDNKTTSDGDNNKSGLIGDGLVGNFQCFSSHLFIINKWLIYSGRNINCHFYYSLRVDNACSLFYFIVSLINLLRLFP